MKLFGERLRLQLVGELSQLVQVDPRPEAKRVRNCLWHRLAADRGRLTQSSTDGAVYRLLERNAEFPRAPLQ